MVQTRTVIINEGTSKTIPLELQQLHIEDEWKQAIETSIDEFIAMTTYGKKARWRLVAVCCFVICTIMLWPLLIWQGLDQLPLPVMIILLNIGVVLLVILFIWYICKARSIETDFTKAMRQRCEEVNERANIRGRVHFSSGKQTTPLIVNGNGNGVAGIEQYSITVEWQDNVNPPSYEQIKRY